MPRVLYEASYIGSPRVFVSIFAGIWGIATLFMTIINIGSYCEDILGYKNGKYREVEGIVEDYTKHPHSYTFTINGVELEISDASFTWGYTYRSKKNVFTGDGQHLRIRYTSPTTILYIEEIGPPVKMPDDTEEAQQEEMRSRLSP